MVTEFRFVPHQSRGFTFSLNLGIQFANVCNSFAQNKTANSTFNKIRNPSLISCKISVGLYTDKFHTFKTALSKLAVNNLTVPRIPNFVSRPNFIFLNFRSFMFHRPCTEHLQKNIGINSTLC